MMDQNTARTTLQFLNRVNLTGQEVSAWLGVVGALNEIIDPQPEKEPDDPSP